MIIGLSGKSGAGKDTVANFIQEQRLGGKTWDRYAFASPIKDACNLIFGWDHRHSFGHLKEVVDENFGISPRYAYQTLGTGS